MDVGRKIINMESEKYIKIAKLFKNEPAEIISIESIPESCRWNGVDLRFQDGSIFQICLDNKFPRYRFFDADLYEYSIPQEICREMDLIYYGNQN